MNVQLCITMYTFINILIYHQLIKFYINDYYFLTNENLKKKKKK